MPDLDHRWVRAAGPGDPRVFERLQVTVIRRVGTCDWGGDDCETAVPVLGAGILVAVAGIVGWAIWPSAKPHRPAAAPLPTASVVPVQAAPPTVATPTPATAAPETTPAAELPLPSTEPQTPTTPTEFTAADDQRLFANLRQYGYPIADPENVARVAHTYCHALQRGESSEQADAEAAPLLANPADETAITAAASLALSHCNG
jgi:Protein of unknown function (DUF732)